MEILIPTSTTSWENQLQLNTMCRAETFFASFFCPKSPRISADGHLQTFRGDRNSLPTVFKPNVQRNRALIESGLLWPLVTFGVPLNLVLSLLIKEERKEIGIGKFSLDGSSHQTWDAAFTPATPHDLQHSRANTDSHNSHNTHATHESKAKYTQPSQRCSGGHITQNPFQNRCGCCLFAYGEYTNRLD
jgi:hypothetical protein